MANEFHQISSAHLSIEKVAEIIEKGMKLSLSNEAEKAVIKCRKYLDDKIQDPERMFYGINTGFGSLCNVKIEPNQISELQRNLVVSHACGLGKKVPSAIVKLMLLLKIQSLSYGHSGVALATIERLIAFFNNDVLPVVFDTGSLGASGDLAPLAHLALPLIGEGDVLYNNELISAKELNSKMGWPTLTLQSKEGLALLNGTQFMSAYGLHLIINARSLSVKMDLIACMSLDAWKCRLEPFNDLVHQVRPHKGQIETARFVRETLAGSAISATEKEQVQDPYSFRCIPQVHGASKDVIRQVSETFTIEINGVTDNPNVFPDEDEIISAGNFHGQPLAMALDYLKLALAELGNISERRVYLMLSGQRALPAYLTPNQGLHSGLMIPQYAGAALVSKNKQLCTPASADSIPSSNGQEDHVSMGANAATQCLDILDNVMQLAGIELLNAAQALEFSRPLKSSTAVERLYSDYRNHVSFVDIDRVMQPDLAASLKFVQEGM